MTGTLTDMEKQPLLTRDGGSPPEENPQASLSQLQNEMYQAQRRYLRAWSRTTAGTWHRYIMYGVSILLTMVMVFSVAVIVSESPFDDEEPGFATGKKVQLEAHIMSKCPDARDCLRELILPAMQQVSDQVNFTLSFIGRETDHDDGILCMHGPSECVGDIIELCAAEAYPDPRLYLGFTMCLSRDYQNIPERSLVEDCALEHGLSMQKINECSIDDDGEFSGVKLKQSFRRSAAANVTTSCTVRLNDEVRCVRDGGKWSNCDGGSEVKDLVKDIRALAALSY